MPRQAALALDRFQHRRFLAADIGAGAAAQVNLAALGEARFVEERDLLQQDVAALRVFVAQVDVDVGRVHRPGADQHAFEHAVRIGFEIDAILEGAGLALVGVDRHQSRRLLGSHQAPFAAGGKSGAAQAAQSRILERLQHLLERLLARKAGFEKLVAAGGSIGLEAGIARRVADGDDRGVVAATHAGRAHHPHLRPEPVRQFLQQGLRAEHLAGERIADAHGQRRRRDLAVEHDVEMRVERRHLVDLDQRQLHLLGQRHQMPGVQTAVIILQQVEIFDQQIVAARALTKKPWPKSRSGKFESTLNGLR